MKNLKKQALRILSLAFALSCSLALNAHAAPNEADPGVSDLFQKAGSVAAVGFERAANLKEQSAAAVSPTAAPAGEEAIEPTAGTVTGGTINVRSGPDTSYDRITQLCTNAKVTIVGKTDGWYHITFDGYDGYISGEYLVEGEIDAVEPITGTVTGGTINIRTGPDTSCDRITQLRSGDKVTIMGKSGEWYYITFDENRGYIFGEYLVEGDVDVADAPSGVGAQVALNAQNHLGTPYVYGGSRPGGFDCSGFTMYLYSQYGYSLPHTARGQYAMGRKVSKSELQPGDLVFFSSRSSGSIDHVGVYIGNGNVIHARMSIARVGINNLSESYYTRYYYGACRIA